jgi:hypothetical protein
MAGGLVFYDKGSYSDGWRYLEAAASDNAYGYIRWNMYTNSLVTTGASGSAIGTGMANTAAIMLAQGSTINAAQLCDDLVSGGYGDWFLPSRDELVFVYTNLKVAGKPGFADWGYWSSTEDSGNSSANAWSQDFRFGGQTIRGKNDLLYVRAVRYF